jgi:RNA polymerase sigma factor (sigma-70 family)
MDVYRVKARHFLTSLNGHADPEGGDIADPSALPPDEDLMLRESSDRLQRALAKLSERDRLVLRLYSEGRSYQEIANCFVVKPTTVNNWISRAIAKLRKLLKEKP